MKVRSPERTKFDDLPYYSDRSTTCQTYVERIFRLPIKVEEIGRRDYWHENEKLDLDHIAEPR